MAEHGSSFGEGTDVGLVGGVVVAVFFLIIDLIAGIPLRTPSVLGQVLLFGGSGMEVGKALFGPAVVYTAVHFIAFALLGIVLVKMVHLATDNSVVRFALLPLFLAFEVFFYGVVSAVANEAREIFPFWRIALANTLAAVAMGIMLWRNHPAFRRVLAETPLGVPDED